MVGCNGCEMELKSPNISGDWDCGCCCEKEPKSPNCPKDSVCDFGGWENALKSPNCPWGWVCGCPKAPKSANCPEEPPVLVEESPVKSPKSSRTESPEKQ